MPHPLFNKKTLLSAAILVSAPALKASWRRHNRRWEKPTAQSITSPYKNPPLLITRRRKELIRQLNSKIKFCALNTSGKGANFTFYSTH
ncbi:secreted protein [Beggiatoa sp. SS]|nr:secreted protein [Beggiatoa sp. SS]